MIFLTIEINFIIDVCVLVIQIRSNLTSYYIEIIKEFFLYLLILTILNSNNEMNTPMSNVNALFNLLEIATMAVTERLYFNRFKWWPLRTGLYIQFKTNNIYIFFNQLYCWKFVVLYHWFYFFFLYFNQFTTYTNGKEIKLTARINVAKF